MPADDPAFAADLLHTRLRLHDGSSGRPGRVAGPARNGALGGEAGPGPARACAHVPDRGGPAERLPSHRRLPPCYESSSRAAAKSTRPPLPKRTGGRFLLRDLCNPPGHRDIPRQPASITRPALAPPAPGRVTSRRALAGRSRVGHLPPRLLALPLE